MIIEINGREFVHRWSQHNHHEFTPRDQENLKEWREMITIIVFPAVRTTTELAVIANTLLAHYEKGGMIIRTTSRPADAAEHLAVAALGNMSQVEIAFCRVLMIDGVGAALVHSHRLRGENAQAQASDWLERHGPQTESALMAWAGYPRAVALEQLEQRARAHA